jgi:CBS domain-containing protein
MLCEQIMNRNVKALNEQDSAQFAARVMRDANVGFLPVCGPSGKVVGAVTDRDIVVRLAADSGNLSTSVAHLMSRDIISCAPKDDVRRVQELMLEHKKSRVVCVDDQGRPIGIITISDIAQHEDAPQVAKLMRTITTRDHTRRPSQAGRTPV